MGMLRWLGLLMLLGAAFVVIAFVKDALLRRSDVREGRPVRQTEPQHEHSPNESLAIADTIPAVLGLPEAWRDEQSAHPHHAPTGEEARRRDNRAA